MVVPRSHSEDAVKDTTPFADARRRLPIAFQPIALYVSRMLTPRTLLLVGAVAALAAPATASATLSFGPAQQLPHGDPNAHPYYPGGEPSLAFDPSGDGHAYVTAPQGIPAAVGGAVGADSSQGVATWASSDGGLTFPTNVLAGSAIGGGDSDVEVLGNHHVLVADLEAVAADICTSTDFGKTYPDCANGLATNQQGPENDREWLSRGPKGEVYLTYHDFAGGFPIIERSDDEGQSFTPCGLIIDPNGPAAQNYTPAGGTLVSKPVVGPDGTVYVQFSTPDATASPVGAALDHMYMAVAKGGCTGQTVFTDYPIYENTGANVANIFQAEGLDGGGELYVLIGGHLSAADANRTNLYLFTSTDGGKTWRHVQVNPSGLGANVLPTVAGGQARGEAVLGWFGSTATDPNDQKAQWRYYSATTYDGGQTFSETTVTPDPIHYGDICTQGIFCGLIPGQPSNRNLADFSSAAVNPATGCSALAIPGDPYNRPDQGSTAPNNFESSAYVALQQDQGDCLTAANSGAAATSAAGPASDGTGAGTVGSGGVVSGCVDRAAPASRFSKAHTASRSAGLRLSGTSQDRGCGASGAGTVKRVSVAVGHRVGSRCRFLHANGSFGPKVSCTRATFLPASGTGHWSLRVNHRLPAGTYVAWVRGVDRAGNVERRAATRNRLVLRVR